MLKKIAIFCGGPSSEHEVSLSSTKTICEFLDKKKYEILVCYLTKELKVELIFDGKLDFTNIKATTPLSEILQKLNKENYFAFLAGIHGEFAEDGQLQKLLEQSAIPFSGSNSTSSALCMDKFRTLKKVKNVKDIFIPQTFLHKTNDFTAPIKLAFPFIVKPNALGSSVGLHIVNNQKEFFQALSQINRDNKVKDVLLQELITDAIEITCGCLENKNGSFVILPPVEIHPKKNILFDYSSKYEAGASEEITPPISISHKLSQKISKLSCELHKLLGCKTYSRTDFMVKQGKIFFLETNTLPGMTITSLLPQEAAAIGISFSDLLDFIISNS